MFKSVRFFVLSFGVFAVGAASGVTATKEWVQRATNDVLVSANRYTDERVGAESLTRLDATNIAVAVVARDAFARDGSDTLGGSLKLPIDGSISFGGTYDLSIQTGSIVVNGTERLAFSSEIPDEATVAGWGFTKTSPVDFSAVTNVAEAVVARDALPRAYGVASDLTVEGELRLRGIYGDVDGVIMYSGSDEDNYTDWHVGVPGFWLGSYRFRNPGSGNVATLAFMADLPNLAPYAAAASVASNALPRVEAALAYASKAELSSMSETCHAAAMYTMTSATAYAARTNSVQYIDLTGLGALSISPPPAVDGRARDWLVYVFAESDKVGALTFAGFTRLLAVDGSATNKTVMAGVTMFAFSEISSGTFVVGRHELTDVTPAQ